MTTLEKYFQNKTYLDVLEIMVKSVELEIPDFEVNMDSFGNTEEINVKTGETKTTNKDFVSIPMFFGLYTKKEEFEKVTVRETFKTEIKCFGCAATKTLYNIFNQENPEWTIFDAVEKSINEDGYSDDNYYLFELLFDNLRKLHIINANCIIKERLPNFNHLLFPTDLVIPNYVSQLTTEYYKTEIQNWKLWLNELKNNK